MKNILVVYNTCGISGKENSSVYIKNISSILKQNCEFDLVISSCLNSDYTINNLKKYFGKNVKYNIIEERHPVNVTFNHSVIESIKRNGRYLGYVYVDSGSYFSDENLLKGMCEKLYTKKYGMITPQPSTDTEYYAGLKIGRYRGDDEYAKKIMFENGDYVIPVGRGLGTHTNLISDTIQDFYGRCYPDIFAGHCTESTFSFLISALKLQWVLLKDYLVDHTIGIDGQSSGFDTMQHFMSGGQTYEHPYVIKSILERVCTQEAYDNGMGYEECRNIMLHREDQFDDNYHCLNDRLKYIIKESLFLKQNELDYANIKHQFTN